MSLSKNFFSRHLSPDKTRKSHLDLSVGPVPADGAHASIEQVMPFVNYLSDCLERALLISIKAARGENIADEDDFEKQLKIIERNSRKQVPEGSHVVTVQDKIDVFNKFHRPLTDRLISALTPAFAFYNTLTIHYYMSKDRDQINGNGFFELDRKRDLSADMCEKDMVVLKEAQSILFHISLQGVKPIYNFLIVTTRGS